LQAEPTEVSTEDKIELIGRLVAAGHRRIEATSFVNPKAVPKMADAAAVMAGVPRVPGVRYSVLALNMAGLERALQAGVDEITGVVCATDTFSQQNQRTDVDGAIARWNEICAAAKASRVRTTAIVSAAFGCPYEGEVTTEQVVGIASRLAATEPDELCLADTIGAGVPTQVRELFDRIAAVAGSARLRGHFHNTRNTALANIFAALEAGVRVFDTSLGGVGGCPFAPRATGNVPTEDVSYMIERMGYATGLSLERLIETTTWFEGILGHAVPSLVAKAGPFPPPAPADSRHPPTPRHPAV
jgi:hydroxymethylglutaryl-CoA lyase